MIAFALAGLDMTQQIMMNILSILIHGCVCSDRPRCHSTANYGEQDQILKCLHLLL